jgi:hypothetical protein
MGSIAIVRCSKCRFKSREVCGLRGDYGFSGEVVVTVICTKRRKLVNVGVPGLNVAMGGTVPPINGPWPSTTPCPTRGCGATDHRPWDPETAICPSCGEPGCEVVDVGCWD